MFKVFLIDDKIFLFNPSDLAYRELRHQAVFPLTVSFEESQYAAFLLTVLSHYSECVTLAKVSDEVGLLNGTIDLVNSAIQKTVNRKDLVDKKGLFSRWDCYNDVVIRLLFYPVKLDHTLYPEGLGDERGMGYK